MMTTGYEPEIMKYLLPTGSGIFGCNAYSVFSIEAVEIGRTQTGEVFSSIAIPGPNAWRGPIPGSNFPAWHNTNVFSRAWLQIGLKGLFKSHMWTVKADVDAVFIPSRLRSYVRLRGLNPRTDLLYFNNCQQWDSLQGPLEVMSNAAATAFFQLQGQNRCFESLKWQDWGEDWFVQHCLSLLGARPVDGYDIMDDQWCGQPAPNCLDGKVAFHPFKSLAAFRQCAEQAQAR